MIDVNLLPPADVIDHQEIRQAIQDYHQARAAAREARKELVRLERDREVAVQRDIEATADAAQKGVKDPGGKHLASFEAKLADLTRQVAALELLEQRKAQELMATIDEHRDEWRAQLDAQVDQIREERDRHLDAAERSHEQLSTAYALRAFARDLDRYRGGYVRRMKLPRVGDGDVVEISDTFEALRSVAAEPVAQITNPAQVVRRWCVNAKFESDGSDGGSMQLVGYRVEHDGHVYNPGDIFMAAIDREVQAALAQGAIRELEPGTMLHEQGTREFQVGAVSGGVEH